MQPRNRRSSIPWWVFEPPQRLGAGAADIASRLPRRQQRVAEVIYGETSGVYPRSIDPNRRVDDPDNWDPHSREELARARRAMGIVSERNRRTHPVDGSRSRNPIEALQWGEAASAARTMDRVNLPKRIINFYIRNRDVEPTAPHQRLEQFGDVVYIGTIGADAPFRNVGRGDVEPGDNIVIDFYGLPENE